MKQIALLIALIFAADTMAGLPPTTLKGQEGTKATTFNFEVPNKQHTKTSTGGLIETGNNNILANPSFEHLTFGTSWSTSGGTYSSEASIVIHGKKSLKNIASASTVIVTQDSTLFAAQFADSVQGVIRIRIKNTAPDLYLCQRLAGATVASSDGTKITNCLAISTANTWGLYKLPVLLGATSNGLAIVSLVATTAASTTTTGTFYVDDAQVEVADIIDTQPVIGPWTSYTPTFTGFGTAASIECQHRQNGSNRDIRCKFVSGIPTGTEARVSLPVGDTSAGVSVIPSIQVIGNYVRSVASSLAGYALSEPSVTYFTLGQQSASQNGLAKLLGSNFSTGETVSIFASIPIEGLSGSTSTYTSQCQSDTQCENVFSAQVSSTGVVTGENLDWINGSCTNASPTVCTYNTGIFTVAPNCWHDTSAILIGNVTSSSTTVSQQFSGSSKFAFNIQCQKQGADFKAKRVIVGDFESLARVATIKDVKASTVQGGTFTGGTYQDRTLNTLDDPMGIVTSLSSNTFTLPAGTYLIDFSAPAFSSTNSGIQEHKAKIRNTTDSTDSIIGSVEYNTRLTTSSVISNRSVGTGIITITAPKAFKLQHYATAGDAASGSMGAGSAAMAGDSNVFSIVTIRRLR